MDQTPSHADHRILFAVLASGLLVALGIGLFSFTVPLLSLDQRAGTLWLGSAFAGFYLARLIAAPLAGTLTDRAGPRLPLLAATVAGAVVPLAWFADSSLYTLYSIQFVLGIVSGLVRPVGMAALGTSNAGPKLSRWFALHSFAYNSAFFIGPLLGGALYLDRDMTPVLLGLSLCMGLAAFVIFLFMPHNAAHRRKGAPSLPQYGSFIDGIFLLLAILGRTIGIGALTAFYPVLLATVLGWRGPEMGALFALPSLAASIGLLVFKRFQTGRPRLVTVATGMLLSGGALFVLGECTAPWQFAATGIVMGIGGAISIPASMAAASALSNRQGLVFGTAHFVAGAGFLIGPILGGLAIRNFHSVTPALQLAAAIGVFCTMPLLASGLRDHLHWGRKLAWSGTLICAVLAGLLMGILADLKTELPKVADKPTYQFTDVALGTIINLTLEADSKIAAEHAARKTIAAMRSLQQEYDFRNPQGAIGRINQGAGQNWVHIATPPYRLLKRAVMIAAKTGGAFDPTVGALTSSPLYFAMEESLARIQDGLVDYRLVRFDDADQRVRLAKREMVLDLGGIAKGTIIDAAVGLLRKQGIQAGIVEAGGDLYCFGNREWIVGIRHPRKEAVYAAVTLREQAMCGSGDYQQFVTVHDDTGPNRRHHILDPALKAPAHKSIGVTVIADTAELADALATAFFVLGPAKGESVRKAEFPSATALWFSPDLTITASENFPTERR